MAALFLEYERIRDYKNNLDLGSVWVAHYKTEKFCPGIYFIITRKEEDEIFYRYLDNSRTMEFSITYNRWNELVQELTLLENPIEDLPGSRIDYYYSILKSI